MSFNNMIKSPLTFHNQHVHFAEIDLTLPESLLFLTDLSPAGEAKFLAEVVETEDKRIYVSVSVQIRCSLMTLRIEFERFP